MKCSKCGYLGFERGDRCRNCGYEFSLAESFVLPDLPMRQDEGVPEEPGEDDHFALIKAAAAPRAAAVAPATKATKATKTTTTAKATAVALPATVDAESELLLFGEPFDDDLPLITKSSPPRPPLSVRRSTPEVPRLRTVAPRSASLDLGLEIDASVAEPSRSVASERAQSDAWSASDERGEDAGAVRRVLASVVDSIVLLAIDAAVIYLTMQICGVTIAESGLLPKGPLVAFLVVQNVGYLVAFTAGGQTLGKMATGIKVVPSNPLESLDLTCALKRTVAWLVLAFPGGLGLLSAFFSQDHRGLHDRFAGTRVVRASA